MSPDGGDAHSFYCLLEIISSDVFCDTALLNQSYLLDPWGLSVVKAEQIERGISVIKVARKRLHIMISLCLPSANLLNRVCLISIYILTVSLNRVNHVHVISLYIPSVNLLNRVSLATILTSLYLLSVNLFKHRRKSRGHFTKESS